MQALINGKEGIDAEGIKQQLISDLPFGILLSFKKRTISDISQICSNLA